MDVQYAADLYAQGWTLRQIAAEVGVHWSTVSRQPRRGGVTMRRGVNMAVDQGRSKVIDGSGSGEGR